MDKIILPIKARNRGDSSVNLRKAGFIPGVVYGNIENTMFSAEEVSLKKAYVKAGESTLVELDLDGKKIPVLFSSIDQHPVSDRMIHVDFFAVNMKKEVEAEVHIRFEGESPAVKDLSAILVTALHEVSVRALPANLPHDLEVDLGKLTEFGSTITVADIKVPEGVEILNDKDDVIAIAQEPREEEVEEAPVVAEGAEGATAEGAAPAEGAAAEGGEKKED
jgi:large subunit ribosomal protein L25